MKLPDAPSSFYILSCTFLSVGQIMLPVAHLLCVCLSVNLIILVLLAVAFLIIVERNLLNLSDFLYKESPGMFKALGARLGKSPVQWG